jgi:hypothetical protein
MRFQAGFEAMGVNGALTEQLGFKYPYCIVTELNII